MEKSYELALEDPETGTVYKLHLTEEDFQRAQQGHYNKKTVF